MTLLLCLFSTRALAKSSGYRYFDVLELPVTATTREITKQYRAMSKKNHPDRNKSEDAHEKFAEVAEAYEVLSNEQERSSYISMGHEEYVHSKKRGDSGGDHHDFWGDFPFSFFGGGRPRGTEKAPTLRMRLYISLEQAYFGDFLHVVFWRPVLCMHADSCTIPRNDCAGQGTRVILQQVAPGFSVQNQIEDDSCVGSKKGWKKNCDKCPSGPTAIDKTVVSVYVEPGMVHGQQLNFALIGWQKLGHEPGDLQLDLYEQAHADFVRRGNNLHMDMRLTLLEALVGFSKEIRHLNGKMITVQRSEVTADRETLVLHDLGMPLFEREGEFGSLIIMFQVQYPIELNDKERSLIQDALGAKVNWKYTVNVKR